MKFHSHITSWFLLLFTAMTFVVFLPLYMGEYTLRSEAVDLLMPAFSHMRDALLQGDWPWWNIYQNQGIATSVWPLYWNPVCLLLAWALPSPDLALNAWYLMLLFIAGLGFYKFAGLFLKDQRLITLSGLCYPLTGFFVVQSQDIGLLTTAAWLPLLSYETIRYQNTGKFHHLSFLALGYFMFITGTSSGFVLMITCFLGILMAYGVWSKKHPITRAINPFATIILTGFLVWKIYWERFQWYVDSPVNGSLRTGVSQSLQDLSSLVLSKTTGTQTWFMGQKGPVEFHLFTGLIILVFALLSFWYSKKRMDKQLAYGCLLLLFLVFIFSFFEYKASGFSGMTGLAVSAGLKILLVTCLMISGFRGLEKISSEPENGQKPFLLFSLVFAAIALITMGLSSIRPNSALTNWFIQMDLWKSALFLLVAGILFWVRGPSLRLLLLSGLILIETGLSSWLNQDSNLYNEYPSSFFSEEIGNREIQPKTVDLSAPVGRYTDEDLKVAALDRNTGTLFRRIVRDGYWPWMTKLHEENENTFNRDKQLRFPLFYFSRDTSSIAKPNYTNYDNAITVLSESDHTWELAILSEYEKFLILNQNYDRNWLAYLDGERFPVFRTDAGMMRIPVMPGLHKVTFQYRTDGLLHIFVVSMIALAVMVFFLFVKKVFPFSVLVAGIPVIVLFLLAPTRSQPDFAGYIQQPSDGDSADYILNYEEKTLFWHASSDQITIEDSFDGYRSEKLSENAEYGAMLQLQRNALKGKKELEYRFHLKSTKPINTAVVLKTYSADEDSYNIQYITSLNSDNWKVIEGRFPLEALSGPLVKLDFYIWNHEKQDFLIDDIQVKLNP